MTQGGGGDPGLSSTAADSSAGALDATAPVESGGRTAGVVVGAVVDGQFRIERLLGKGGMGAVFLARDLRLDRDIALKLGNVVSASALHRVEREALALARLQHPNVVVIHQVGKHEDRLYLAMEYVAGGNARQWLERQRRSWREIALLYAAAAEGLAAAHAAGFIHRDFKPDNVLVGEDGRPRVADFGLVRATTDSHDPAAAVVTSSPSLGSMTQTGAVLGTPAYMAPEQFAGTATDARTDQFALCASVWEALFGNRPYSGSTPDEIAQSIDQARFELPKHDRHVPRRVIAALRRGLSRDREARWPSLAPLIAELRHDPARRRRNVLLAAGAIAVLGAAVAVAVVRRQTDPCSDGPAELAETWNPARADALASALDRAQLTASWPGLRGQLDAYGDGWVTGHRAACRATRVDGSQSEAILDQRMLCLSRARAQLDSVLATMIEHRDALADAASEVAALPSLATCADLTALAQQVPLPNDPVLRARIEAAAKLVDKASGASLSGWSRDLARADEALAAARETHWPPLIAQAIEMHAGYLSDEPAVKEYRAAVAAALAAGDDRTAAWAFADGAWALATKPAQAAEWIELARAMWVRLGKPADLGNRIEGADAERLFNGGDAAGGLEATRRATAYNEAAYPTNLWDRADGHFNLARAFDAAGNYDEAQREIDAAIDLARHIAGDAHPVLIGYLELAADLANRRGKVDDAIAFARRAVAIGEGWYGKDDHRLAPALDTLGQLLALHGDIEAARAPLERALALDPDSRETHVRFSLAMLEGGSGHPARAIELVTTALAQAERDTGVDNAEHVPMLLALGIWHRQLGHLDDSQRYLERTVHLSERALGGAAPQTVNAKIELSYTLVAQHRGAAARELLAPALAVPDLPPPVAAELHVASGQALWETGDHASGRREVESGRDAFAALGAAFHHEHDQASAWLQLHK